MLLHQKFKYHPAFLVAFYNRERQRATTRQGDESNIKDASLKDIAIAEIVSYVFETQMNSTESVVFRLTDLVSMYEESSIPSSLLQLVKIIYHGPDIKTQLEIDRYKSDLTIAQL